MDIILTIFKYIGIAGVVCILFSILGYGFLWSFTYQLQKAKPDDEPPDYDPDPPDGEVVIKKADTLKVSAFSLVILSLQFLLL